jgi:hypothetical protein
VDAIVVAVLDQAVVSAFDDGEAEVERIAHGIKTFPLRQTALHRNLVEAEERRVVLVEADDGEVVRQVYAQQTDIAVTAIGRHIFKAIGRRLERDLRDHVVVGDGKAVGGNEKSRTDRDLTPCVGDQRANLQEPRRRRGIDALGNGSRALRRPRRAAIDRHSRQQQQGTHNVGDRKDQEVTLPGAADALCTNYSGFRFR